MDPSLGYNKVGTPAKIWFERPNLYQYLYLNPTNNTYTNYTYT